MRLVADLAQRHDGILVVVAVDGDRRAGGNHAGAVAGQQHEIEPVLDLLNAVFDGDAGHARRLLPADTGDVGWCRLIHRMRFGNKHSGLRRQA